MQSVLHKVIGPKEVHPENLEGRVAVVTGGALGIGYDQILLPAFNSPLMLLKV